MSETHIKIDNVNAYYSGNHSLRNISVQIPKKQITATVITKARQVAGVNAGRRGSLPRSTGFRICASRHRFAVAEFQR